MGPLKSNMMVAHIKNLVLTVKVFVSNGLRKIVSQVDFWESPVWKIYMYCYNNFQ